MPGVFPDYPAQSCATPAPSAPAALTRKTKPPHEIRYHPRLYGPGKGRASNPRNPNAVEPVQGRIHVEKINEPFLFRDRGSPAEYGAGLSTTDPSEGPAGRDATIANSGTWFLFRRH
jgi:hypothetical protein